jgi:hypothetical protein
MAKDSWSLTPIWTYPKLPLSPTLNSTSHLPSRLKDTKDHFNSSWEYEVNRSTPRLQENTLSRKRSTADRLPIDLKAAGKWHTRLKNSTQNMYNSEHHFTVRLVRLTKLTSSQSTVFTYYFPDRQSPHFLSDPMCRKTSRQWSAVSRQGSLSSAPNSTWTQKQLRHTKR